MNKMFETTRSNPRRPKDYINFKGYNITWRFLPPARGFQILLEGEKIPVARHDKNKKSWHNPDSHKKIPELQGKTIKEIIEQGLLDKYLVS